MTWPANWVLLSLEDTLLVIAEALIAVLTATVWKCEFDRSRSETYTRLDTYHMCRCYGLI